MYPIKKYSVLISLLCSVLFTGCSQTPLGGLINTVLSSLPLKSEALSANDNSNNGIYKGIISGNKGKSTGSFKIIINNHLENLDSTSKVLMVLNYNQTKNAKLNGVETFSGESFKYQFKDSQYAFKLNIDSKGEVSQPELSMNNQPEKDLDILVTKETSSKLVETYEGTFSGDYNGVWNILVQDTNAICSYNANVEGLGSSGNLRGSLTSSSNSRTISLSGLASATGTISGNNITGSWNALSQSGKWNGARKF